MTDYFEYEVAGHGMLIPAHLRPRKVKGYFSVRRRDNKHDIQRMGVEIVDDDTAEAYRVNHNSLRSESEWKGVRMLVVRRGSTRFSEGGFEILHTSINSINGDVNNVYEAVMPTGTRNKWVFIGIHGRGDVDRFYIACQEVASSVRLKGTPGDTS